MITTDMKLPLGYMEISQILPHRYPFLFIDQVTELKPGILAKAYKNVSCNEPFFSGHFPGLPIMPGVLQIEAMGQCGGILVFYSGDFQPHKQIAYLASVEEAKFKKPVRPGDRLDIQADLIVLKRHFCKIKGVATVNGELVSEATLIAVIQQRPNTFA